MKKIFIVLDCLMTDDECFTQIKEYFDLCNNKIDDIYLRNILNRMVNDKLIYSNESWTNEHNEYPYSLTDKGRERWKELNKQFCDELGIL